MSVFILDCPPCCAAAGTSECHCNDIQTFAQTYTFTISGVGNGDCSCCNNYNRTVVLNYVGTDGGNCVWQEDPNAGQIGCNANCTGKTSWKLFRDTTQSPQPYWVIESQPDGIRYVMNQPGASYFGYPVGFFAPGQPVPNPIAPPTNLCVGFPNIMQLTPVVPHNPCLVGGPPPNAVMSPCVYVNAGCPAEFNCLVYPQYRLIISGFANGTSTCCTQYNGTITLNPLQSTGYGFFWISGLFDAIANCSLLSGRLVMSQSGGVQVTLQGACLNESISWHYSPGPLSGPGPWVLDRFSTPLPHDTCCVVPSQIMLEGVGATQRMGVCTDSTVAPPATLTATLHNNVTSTTVSFPIQYGLNANGLPPCFSYWMGTNGTNSVSMYFLCNFASGFFTTPPALYVFLSENCDLITNASNDCFHAIPGSTLIPSYVANPFFATVTIGNITLTITE